MAKSTCNRATISYLLRNHSEQRLQGPVVEDKVHQIRFMERGGPTAAEVKTRMGRK